MPDQPTSLPTSQANQNALPDAWIDRLFARFHAMYGKAWLDNWAGIALDDVKAIWAQDLARFDADTLRKALDHCKAHNRFPPSCPEFVGLCLAMRPTPHTYHAISVRYAERDPRVTAAIAEWLRPDRKFDPKGWAREILAGESNGTYHDLRGIHCAKVALGLIVE